MNIGPDRTEGEICGRADGSLNVAVVSLESPTPGSAMEAHLLGVADGLSQMDGFRVAKLWPDARGRANWRAFEILKLNISLARRAVQSDVVYMRWHPLAGPFILACRFRRRPIVLEVNGTSDDLVLAHPRIKWMGPLVRRMAGHQFRRAAAVVAVTDGLARWTRELAPGLTAPTVINNGARAHLSQQRAAADKDHYAVFVGELAPWQGIEVLLDAFDSPHWPSDLDLHVVGDGWSARLVERRARTNERLLFHGRLPRANAQGILARAVVSVSPQSARPARNRYGVSPIKVAESLMLGVPVVLSDCNVSAGFVDDHCLGASFPSDDRESLAVAVSHVLSRGSDDAERRRISDVAVDAMTWERAAAVTAALLRDVARSSCKPAAGDGCRKSLEGWFLKS